MYVSRDCGVYGGIMGVCGRIMCVWWVEGVALWECCVCVRVVYMCIWDCVQMFWGVLRVSRVMSMCGVEDVWMGVGGVCVCVCLCVCVFGCWQA